MDLLLLTIMIIIHKMFTWKVLSILVLKNKRRCNKEIYYTKNVQLLTIFWKITAMISQAFIITWDKSLNCHCHLECSHLFSRIRGNMFFQLFVAVVLLTTKTSDVDINKLARSEIRAVQRMVKKSIFLISFFI